MGRLSSFFARSQGQAPSAEPPPEPVPAAREQGVESPVRLRVPTPGQLRRERRALVRTREDRIRDLGGIMLEMYKRDHFRQELILEQCAELVSLETRLHEVDVQLAGWSSRGSSRCNCGAPIIWGSHFCANCGRPVGDAPVITCPRCGHPLPADASFCAGCGTPIEPAPEAQDQQAGADGDRDPTPDPWEK